MCRVNEFFIPYVAGKIIGYKTGALEVIPPKKEVLKELMVQGTTCLIFCQSGALCQQQLIIEGLGGL